MSQSFEQEPQADADTRADFQILRDRSSEFGPRRVSAALDRNSSAAAAGGARPRVAVAMQEGVSAESNGSGISMSLLLQQSTESYQLPSGATPTQNNRQQNRTKRS